MRSLNRVIIFFLFISIGLFSLNIFAQKNRFYRVKYFIKPRDTFAKILKKFVRNDSVINKNTPMVQKTLNENTNINWENLRVGSSISVYISPTFLDKSKFKRYVAEMKQKIKKVKKIKKNVAKKKKENKEVDYSGFPTGLKSSLFYMASYGSFDQSKTDLATISFLQNSPITLGAAFSYYPKKSLWSYAWSVYGSHLLTAGSNINTTDIELPPEVGINLYAERRFVSWRTTGYFGLDYEKFTTFNLEGIQASQTIFTEDNSVLFLTFGISRVLPIFGKKFFTKLSLSKSITSTLTPEAGGVDPGATYDGYKVLWYLNKKIGQKWFMHTLLKYHTFTGPNDLTVLRFGVGVGYILF